MRGTAAGGLSAGAGRSHSPRLLQVPRTPEAGCRSSMLSTGFFSRKLMLTPCFQQDCSLIQSKALVSMAYSK